MRRQILNTVAQKILNLQHCKFIQTSVKQLNLNKEAALEEA